MADASRLEDDITNLIDNALKYSDRRSEVLVSLFQGPDYVTFTVTDSGIGLDLGDERLFNAFGRGENVGHVPGIGLGLFIARHIVDLHGGRISVTRRTDATGTTATVILPFRDAEA